MTLGLKIDVEEVGGRCTLRLEGRIDAVTTPALEREIKHLFDTGHKRLLLDFLKVEYLSSAGMRLLLSSTRKFKEAKGHFVLCNLDEDVMEIIKVAGFERVLRIYANEADGLMGLE